MDGIIDLLDGTWQFNFSEATALNSLCRQDYRHSLEIAPDENGVVDVELNILSTRHRPLINTLHMNSAYEL